jgi:hypothetical protein
MTASIRQILSALNFINAILINHRRSQMLNSANFLKKLISYPYINILFRILVKNMRKYVVFYMFTYGPIPLLEFYYSTLQSFSEFVLMAFMFSPYNLTSSA